MKSLSKYLLALAIVALSPQTFASTEKTQYDDDPSKPLVQGFVEATGQNVDLKGSKIIISLLDVSLQDVPAETLLEVTYSGVDELPLYFTLHGKKSFDPKRSYSVSVLIDRNNDGRLSKGDLFTTQHYSVKPNTGQWVYAQVSQFK